MYKMSDHTCRALLSIVLRQQFVIGSRLQDSKQAINGYILRQSMNSIHILLYEWLGNSAYQKPRAPLLPSVRQEEGPSSQVEEVVER